MPDMAFDSKISPFVEDQLPALGWIDKVGLLAHPYLAKRCSDRYDKNPCCSRALRPEGGWNEFEVDKWHEAGMSLFILGWSYLKVEQLSLNYCRVYINLELMHVNKM